MFGEISEQEYFNKQSKTLQIGINQKVMLNFELKKFDTGNIALQISVNDKSVGLLNFPKFYDKEKSETLDYSEITGLDEKSLEYYKSSINRFYMLLRHLLKVENVAPEEICSEFHTLYTDPAQISSDMVEEMFKKLSEYKFSNEVDILVEKYDNYWKLPLKYSSLSYGRILSKPADFVVVKEEQTVLEETITIEGEELQAGRKFLFWKSANDEIHPIFKRENFISDYRDSSSDDSDDAEDDGWSED